jgi:hypothetical protein
MENITESTFGKEPEAWSGKPKPGELHPLFQKILSAYYLPMLVHCTKCENPCRLLGGDIELSECCAARIEMREARVRDD